MLGSQSINEDATANASILVVQSGTQAATKLSSDLECRYLKLVAGSLAEARKIVASDAAIVGALIEPTLADGCGFKLVDELRSLCITMPILMVTSESNGSMLSHAHLADVQVIHASHAEENLAAFATLVNTAISSARGGIDEVLAEITHAKRLSLRESQILSVAAHGVPRSYLASRLGTSENTVKSQIRSLLDKTKQPNLSEAVWLVHSKTDRC
jgi:DNA-binding NarL/FixJ family response regulator